MNAKRYHRLKEALAFANELAAEAEAEGETDLADCALDTVEAIMLILDREPQPVTSAPFRDGVTPGTPQEAYLWVSPEYRQ